MNVLPYFKFFISEWDNGNIQLCSQEAKGLFIDICAAYWARQGDLPKKLVVQKLCNSNASALQELINEDILSVDDGGKIVVDFLEEQLSEFVNMSEKRRNAANKRWNYANAMQVHSKSNAIREDKIRKEKKREDNSSDRSFSFNPPSLSEVILYFESNDYDRDAAIKAYEYYDERNWIDGNNKQIKSWKNKMRNVWFKPSNKKSNWLT